MFRPVTPDVIEAAKYAIDAWHPHLKYARIGFLFRKEAPVSKGRATLGQAKLVSPDMRAAGLNYDFLIWFAKDRWDSLSADQRIALIDHELCHCQYDEDEEKATMTGHDFEEFVEVVKRHGIWLPSAQPMAQAIQLHLLKVPDGERKIRGVIEAVAEEFAKIPGVSVEIAAAD